VKCRQHTTQAKRGAAVDPAVFKTRVNYLRLLVVWIVGTPCSRTQREIGRALSVIAVHDPPVTSIGFSFRAHLVCC